MRENKAGKTRGIQAILAGAGSVAVMVGTVASGVTGKLQAVLTAVAAVLAMLGAFSRPPKKAE